MNLLSFAVGLPPEPESSFAGLNRRRAHPGPWASAALDARTGEHASPGPLRAPPVGVERAEEKLEGPGGRAARAGDRGRRAPEFGLPR